MTEASKKRFRRIALAGAIIVLLAASYTAVFARQIRCSLVAYSDLRRVGSHLYVDPRLSADRAAAIERMLVEARRRSSALLGSSEARPIIIAGPDMRTIEHFGQEGNSTAVSHLYLGRAYIVLGPDGLDTNVIAHELTHAELAARLGWLMREIEIPSWFDEGLAMQVDHRAEYDEDAWRRETKNGAAGPGLDELRGASEFGSDNYVAAFTTSKHEVARWLGVVGTRGLRDLVRRLNDGASFDEAYRAIELGR